MSKTVNKYKVIKTIISLLLCITITVLCIYSNVQEVYAVFPLAIPLIGAGLILGAGLLVMAGLQFESEYQATTAANAWYYDSKQSTEVEIVQAMFEFGELYQSNDAIKIVSDELFGCVKSWVDENYDVGQNNNSEDIHIVQTSEDYWTYYSLNQMLDLGYEIKWLNNLYSIEITDATGNYNTWSIIKNGTDTIYSQLQRKQDPKPKFYIKCNTNNALQLFLVGYALDGIPNSTHLGSLSSNSIPNIGSTHEYNTVADERMKIVEYVYNAAAYGLQSVVDNPDYDFDIPDYDQRAVYVPSDATISDMVGIDYTDLVINTEQAIAGNPPVSGTIDKEWWEDIIGTINTGVSDLGEYLASTYNAAVAEITDRLDANDEDLDPNLNRFNIPSFFILFLDVLIACIALVIRACLYLATIVAIEPDGTLLNPGTLSGLNFFKNQIIPVINISIWDMYSGLMTLVISLSVVKKVRSTHG